MAVDICSFQLMQLIAWWHFLPYLMVTVTSHVLEVSPRVSPHPCTSDIKWHNHCLDSLETLFYPCQHHNLIRIFFKWIFTSPNCDLTNQPGNKHKPRYDHKYNYINIIHTHIIYTNIIKYTYNKCNYCTYKNWNIMGDITNNMMYGCDWKWVHPQMTISVRNIVTVNFLCTIFSNKPIWWSFIHDWDYHLCEQHSADAASTSSPFHLDNTGRHVPLTHR